MRRIIFALFLTVLAPILFASEKKLHACSLLTPSEITSVTGIAVGEAHESDMVIPNGPSKGETMAGCMWGVGQRGMFNLSLIRAAGTPAEREQGLAALRNALTQLKAQGWAVEEKKMGDAWCAVATPPPSKTDAPLMVSCVGLQKGMALSLSSMILKTRVQPEKVKMLFDKVVSRLP